MVDRLVIISQKHETSEIFFFLLSDIRQFLPNGISRFAVIGQTHSLIPSSNFVWDNQVLIGFLPKEIKTFSQKYINKHNSRTFQSPGGRCLAYYNIYYNNIIIFVFAYIQGSFFNRNLHNYIFGNITSNGTLETQWNQVDSIAVQIVM